MNYWGIKRKERHFTWGNLTRGSSSHFDYKYLYNEWFKVLRVVIEWQLMWFIITDFYSSLDSPHPHLDHFHIKYLKFPGKKKQISEMSFIVWKSTARWENIGQFFISLLNNPKLELNRVNPHCSPNVYLQICLVSKIYL